MTMDSWLSLAAASALSFIYVGSLYVWSSNGNRDDPRVIRRRFLSAFSTVIISPSIVKAFGSDTLLDSHSLWKVIGVRTEGLVAAAVLPTMLTAILFSGSLTVFLSSLDIRRTETIAKIWCYVLRDLTFWRNYVVAPFTEEFTFRACMIPVLLRGFTPSQAVIISPLLFGIAHFHHMVDRVKTGLPLRSSLLISSFQFAYTSVFGVYSAYLYMRTGHLSSCVLTHSFCNFMGLPDFGELIQQQCPVKKALLFVAYVAGPCLFCYLLTELTDPHIYSNVIYSW